MLVRSIKTDAPKCAKQLPVPAPALVEQLLRVNQAMLQALLHALTPMVVAMFVVVLPHLHRARRLLLLDLHLLRLQHALPHAAM